MGNISNNNIENSNNQNDKKLGFKEDITLRIEKIATRTLGLVENYLDFAESIQENATDPKIHLAILNNSKKILGIITALSKLVNFTGKKEANDNLTKIKMQQAELKLGSNILDKFTKEYKISTKYEKDNKTENDTNHPNKRENPKIEARKFREMLKRC